MNNCGCELIVHEKLALLHFSVIAKLLENYGVVSFFAFSRFINRKVMNLVNIGSMSYISYHHYGITFHDTFCSFSGCLPLNNFPFQERKNILIIIFVWHSDAP